MAGEQAIGVQARGSGVHFDQSARQSLVTVVNSDVRTFIRSETDFRPHLDTELYRDFSIGSGHAAPQAGLGFGRSWLVEKNKY